MHEFNDALCCTHLWQPVDDPLSRRKFICARCGARCVRDDKGQITEYSAGGRKPSEPEHATGD